jgi:hypothetical protein
MAGSTRSPLRCQNLETALSPAVAFDSHAEAAHTTSYHGPTNRRTHRFLKSALSADCGDGLHFPIQSGNVTYHHIERGLSRENYQTLKRALSMGVSRDSQDEL